MKLLKSVALSCLIMFGVAARASASTIWTFDNVSLFCNNCLPGQNTNTVSGFFQLNTALTQVIDWNVDVTGTMAAVKYDYTPADSNYFGLSPTGVTFYNDVPPNFFAPYVTFDFATPLSNAVPTSVALVAGSTQFLAFGQGTFSCSSPCGVLSSAGTVNGTDPSDPVPEPASLGLLGAGLVAAGARLRRARKPSADAGA